MLGKLNKKIKLPSFSLPKIKAQKAKSISGGIVCIDIYNKLVYNYINNNISKGSLSLYNKKNFYISYLYSKDVLSGSVEVTRGISEEDLKDAIEIAAYDELGLDSAVDYIIKYIEVYGANSENRVFDVFAIPVYKLLEIYEDIGSIKHIDYIAPSPLLFGALYKKEYIPRGNVDCFLHFDYDDAFLAIYNDGEFIYSKTLNYTLKKINEEFAKLLAQHIDERDFFSLLKTQGLLTPDSVMQKKLMKIFGDLFNYINDVLQFAKRANSITEFKNFYISSKIGEIRGLSEFAANYININTKNFDIKVSKNASEFSFDPLVEVMIIFAKEYINEKDDRFNFSIFQKEPEFSNRPIGKLTKTITASLILSLAYPAYQLFETYLFEEEYKKLYSLNQNLQIQVTSMKKALEQLHAQKKAVEEKLTKKEKELNFRTKLLEEIYNKKVNYAMKAKVLNDLFAKVNKYHSKVEQVLDHDRNVILKVRSKSDKLITELIKELSFNKQYKVSTDLIKKDENKSIYRSSIKVGLYGKF